MKVRIIQAMSDKELRAAQDRVFHCLPQYLRDKEESLIRISIRAIDRYAEEVERRKVRYHQYNLALLAAIKRSKDMHDGKRVYNFCPVMEGINYPRILNK